MKRFSIILSLITVFIALSNGPFTNAQYRLTLITTDLDRPFKLSRYPAPTEPSTTPFERVHCAEMGNELRVCKHISHAETFFAIESKGRLIGKWPASTYNGGASQFEVLKGDLDGDRVDEIIVANCYGLTNGIGFQYWNISILPNPKRYGFKKPLEFSVEEYGAEGTFVKHQGNRFCNILATEWQDDAIKEPKRKYMGLYLVGRWFMYKSGMLQPLVERRVLARRYLFGFQRERGNSFDNSKKPLSWLKSRLTRAAPVDPLTRLKTTLVLQGQIIGISIRPSESDRPATLEVNIKLDSGGVNTYQYLDDTSLGSKGNFNRFGDSRTGIVYPKAYKPADSKQWLVGKRARIETYRSDYNISYRIIWLE